MKNFKGLTHQEAEESRRRNGSNTLTAKKTYDILADLLE